MKTNPTLLACSLLVLSGFTVNVSLAESLNHTPETLKTEAYIEARLKSIHVTDFNIERVPLSEALEHLDSVLAPHDLQIMFRPYADKDPEVRLKTRNLSFANNLSFLYKQAGYDW